MSSTEPAQGRRGSWGPDVVASTEVFAGTGRFRIEARLGAGGMGVVYRAHDRALHVDVALKTLKDLNPQTLYWFKNEFRALADVEHPNLVRLGDLIGEDGHWFFTMELVEGTDFLSYVRKPGAPEAPSDHSADTLIRDPTTGGAQDAIDHKADTLAYGIPLDVGGAHEASAASAAFDEMRLRSSLSQLAQGLNALHAAGKIHRDIKPSNVMVTTDGRLVLLDFGLVLDAAVEDKSEEGTLRGTVMYMAPEQAAGKRVGFEADWYSVGVILYQVLTGRLPHTGSMMEMLAAKQEREPRSPHALVPGLPEDLVRLAMRLLQRDPAARPHGRELPALLEPRPSSSPALTPSSLHRVPFVGRAVELQLLHDSVAASRQSAVTVLVEGESGIGKSGLVRHFLSQLEEQRPCPLVLTGRCYEREQVPYKGFDGVIDSLSVHLMRLGGAEARRILPSGRDCGILTRIFPVLSRVPAIADVLVPDDDMTHAVDIRVSAFAALRGLLTRMAELQPLVLSIDDLQWADADSLRLLDELLQPPSPPLLLLATLRSGAPAILGDVRHLKLAGLTSSESLRLAELVSEGDPTRTAATIASEAKGNPLFIQELAQHSGTGQPLKLDDAIWQRVCALDEGARQIVELVAVAGAPITLDIVQRCAAMDDAELRRRVSGLRGARLIRMLGTRAESAIEPYHDRIRESVMTLLDETRRIQHHRRLAAELEEAGIGADNPQLLLRHLEAAGENASAAQHAERAAERARSALAFEQAADMYASALRLGTHSEAHARVLRIRFAEALANAGKSLQSAEEFIAASAGANEATRLDCQSRAATQLVGGGDVTRGLELVKSIVTGLGEPWPATPGRAFLSLMWSRTRLRARGLHFTEAPEDSVPPQEMRVLRTFDAINGAFTAISPIRAAAFSARTLRRALDAGQKRPAARALLTEAVLLGYQGSKKFQQAARAIQAAQRDFPAAEDADMRFAQLRAQIVVDICSSRFKEAAEGCAEAEKLFRSATVRVTYEIAAVRWGRVMVLVMMGEFTEAARWMEEYRRDATRRGDRYLQANLVPNLARLKLAEDLPSEAREALAKVWWQLPGGEPTNQDLWQLAASIVTDAYDNNQAQLARHAVALADFQRTRLTFVQMNRVLLWRLVGQLALLRGAAGQDVAASAATALRAARQLEKEKLPFASVCADMLHAGSARLRGRAEECVERLRQVIPAADAMNLLFLAAAARQLLGSQLQGDEGRMLTATAAAYMTRQHIRNPARMIMIEVPGFPAG